MNIEKDILGFPERLVKLIEKYGYWEITKIVIFLLTCIGAFFLVKNFTENFNFQRQKEFTIEALQQNREKIILDHNKNMEFRKSLRPFIVDLLKNTINEMGADRAFVLELHNGTNNIAGLPFIHCSMTYEETSRHVEHIEEDYQNISLTRFDFPEYLHTHDLWYGTVDEFSVIDSKMSLRMKHEGSVYLVITTIRSGDTEIGYFGFTFNKMPQLKEKEMLEHTLYSVQKLSKWLDNNLIKE